MLLAGGAQAAAWKAELMSAAGCACRCLCGRSIRRNAADGGRMRRAASLRLSSGHGRVSDLKWRRGCHRRVRGRRERCGLRRRGARGRRAGQCHRQTGILRFLLRRHRQPLAAGDRNFDGRRGAGVRAGDPRQAGSAAAERLCQLGCRRRQMAQRGESVRSVVLGTPQVLAGVHGPCGEEPA